MGKRLRTPRLPKFEPPFQLYSDLRCPRLYDYQPISQAAHEAMERDKQRRQGIIPLSEFHEEPPLG